MAAIKQWNTYFYHTQIHVSLQAGFNDHSPYYKPSFILWNVRHIISEITEILYVKPSHYDEICAQCAAQSLGFFFLFLSENNGKSLHYTGKHQFIGIKVDLFDTSQNFQILKSQIFR